MGLDHVDCNQYVGPSFPCMINETTNPHGVAEVGTSQLRERTIAIATICGFLTSIVITYVNPFVQNEPGNLGSRVGMIYGSVSILAMAFVFFIVPEMKKRSLEELDDMFHSKVVAWRSRYFVSTGVGAQISTLQGVDGEAMPGKAKMAEEEREQEAGPA